MFKRLISVVLVIMLIASYASAESAPAEQVEKNTIGISDLIGKKLEIVHAEKVLSEEDTTRTLEADLNGTHLSLGLLAEKVVKDDEWTDISSELLGAFASFHWSEPDTLVNEVYGYMTAAPAVGTDEPLWRSNGMEPAFIRAENPYYPELKLDVNGEITKQFQQKLIETGFLTDKADGYFGENTKKAVISLQEFISDRLEDLAKEIKGCKAEEFTEGVVSPELLYYVLSDDFRAYNGTAVGNGSSKEEIRRMQRRLIAFGCLTGKADGIIGDNTNRGILIFQYANSLPQTGIADSKTLEYLFTSKGKAPVHALLMKGSEGYDVRQLQERLMKTGFSTVGVDGKFENGTRAGVESLQYYYQVKEREEYEAKLAAAAPSSPDSEENSSASKFVPTTVVNGIADPMLLDKFYADDFPMLPVPAEKGDKGEDVKRIQRRLRYLDFIYAQPDGSYGKDTVTAVKAFQKRNKLEQTGVCDQHTIDVMFSDDALKALKPYVLKVSISKQRVYAYAPDDDGEYTILKRTMKCSTGKNETPTPTGTFQSSTGPGREWHYFNKFDCWAQYAWHITGDILFHSVIFYEKNGKMQKSTLNNLGRKASHGCIRLSVDDAKWIYRNCPKYTKVIIY